MVGLPKNPLKLYQNLARYPGGKFIFSKIFSFAAPYFRSINARIDDLKPGYAQIHMMQRWSVQNHIGTVHAIAVCNLIEMAMGLVAEATIPNHLRWLPMGKIHFAILPLVTSARFRNGCGLLEEGFWKVGSNYNN
jgi:hypothetical protein